MRYTKTDVENAFRQIARAQGWDTHHADVYSLLENDTHANGGLIPGKWHYKVGRYALDHAACYGGYRIVRCANEQGGEHEVTRLRLNARQFCEAARFLADVREG